LAVGQSVHIQQRNFNFIEPVIFVQHILIMKAIVLIFTLFSFVISPAQAQPDKSDVLELAGLMEGNFSSAAQAAIDTGFYDIRLTLTRVWKDRKDGIWFYIEQAMAAEMEKPYRQRFYRLTQLNDSVIESRVYTIPDPLRFTGAGKNQSLLSPLSVDSLEWRKGCSKYLSKTGKSRYEGTTLGNSCKSNLRGAMYATSEAVITNSGMVTWDRGFDHENKQVWGSEKGGYSFLRIAE
jgi:CpeT protein